MRINDYRAAQIAQSYGLQQTGNDAAAKVKKQGQRADGASLSSAAQELLKARRAAQDAPEVRADLVAELRRQVQSGTYQVDANSLARKLMPLLNAGD